MLYFFLNINRLKTTKDSMSLAYSNPLYVYFNQCYN